MNKPTIINSVSAFACGLFLVGSLVSGSASGQTVKLSGSAVGSTPAILGYNSGHFMPGSNTASWWEYAGVNGARIFASTANFAPGNSTHFRSESNAALGAASKAEFITQRDALRASGTATTYIRWDNIETRYQDTLPNSGNNIVLDYAQGRMESLGVAPLISMTRSLGSEFWPASPTANAAADWQARWLGWQQWYAEAFIQARDHNVTNYQFFNEPDHPNANGLTQSQWLEMVQVGANAVECALEDVNRLYGKNLKPNIYGPVTTTPQYWSGGWGDKLLDNRHNQFINGNVSSYKLFNRYDYHNYNDTPVQFGVNARDTIAAIDSATGGYADSYPLVISEFNTRTSANYDPNDASANPNGYTPNSLTMTNTLGQILARLAQKGTDELYLFKFSNASGSFNGVHWQSDTGTRNVGGASRSAAVYRLFTEGFANKTMLSDPTSTDADLTMVGSYDAAAGRRYAFIVNESGSSAGKTMTMDLTPWNVPVGATVTVKQVSHLHQGGISQVITVPANRTISVTAQYSGAVLVEAPTVSGIEPVARLATADTYVKEGSATTNYNSASSLLVSSGSGLSNHNAAFLKFDLQGLTPDVLAEAVLSVTAKDPGASSSTVSGIVCHVYGLTDSSWQGSTVNWANAPNINRSSSPTMRTAIDQNYVTGVGESAAIVGEFSAASTLSTLRIDVSDWVAKRLAAGDKEATFMITRDVRFEGDFNDTHSLSIVSTEGSGTNASQIPSLTVFTHTAPITISVSSGTQTQLQTGNSLIRGTSPVTKTGAGTVVFDGVNSYSGGTTLEQGAIAITSDTAFGSGAISIVGGTIASQGAARTIANAMTLRSSTASPLTLGGLGQAITVSGRVDLFGGNSRAIRLGNDATIAGRLSNGGFVLDTTSTIARRLTLTGSSDYSGLTDVRSGVLRAQHDNALGSPAAGTTVSGGATLELNGGVAIAAESLTLSGSGFNATTGALHNVSGNNGFGGLVTLAASARITSATGLLTLSNPGTMTGPGFDLTVEGAGSTTIASIIGTGSGGLVKGGAGTLTLAGANTFTGATRVNAGMLLLADAAALATSRVVPLAGGTLGLATRLQATVGGLDPNAGGLIDVGNGAVTVSAGLAADAVRGAIIAGRGDGSWNGPGGITSSQVRADLVAGKPRTIGWLDNGDASITFAYSAPGDTNLDWYVDILDAANFLAGGAFDAGVAASWNEGDFGYDGMVDILDAADFLSAGLFDEGLYNPLSGSDASVAAVPEPALPVTVAAAAATAMLLRRPRSRRCRQKG